MNWIAKRWLLFVFIGAGWAYLCVKPDAPDSLICFGIAAILSKLNSLNQ